MSVLKMSRRSPGSQVDLSRLLLQCRFDFQQKIWGLPVAEPYRAGEFLAPADSAALAAVIVSRLSAPVAGRRPTVRTWLRKTRTSLKT